MSARGCPGPVARGRRGFTLIELLVVIGIIGLLVSILLPTLSRARRQAQHTVCLSNLRQLGMAAMLYANEHQGWFPFRAPNSSAPPQSMGTGWNYPNPTPTNWGRFQAPYGTGGHPVNHTNFWVGYLSGYRQTDPTSVFYCPSASPEFGFHNAYQGEAGSNWPQRDGNRLYLIGYSYWPNLNSLRGIEPNGGGRWWGQGVASDLNVPSTYGHMARKNNDHPSLPLFSDLLEQRADGGWIYMAHSNKGGNNAAVPPTSPVKPAGIHGVSLDGSARWYEYNDDLARSETGLALTLDAARTTARRGFHWPKPTAGRISSNASRR